MRKMLRRTRWYACFIFCGITLFGSEALSAQNGAQNDPNRLLRGERLVFDEQAPEGTRTVGADKIKAAILHNVPVLVIGAVIHGEIDLRYATIDQEIEFQNCKFDTWIDFSYATFKRNLNIGHVWFTHGATFESGNFLSGLSIQQSTFSGPTVFQNIRVEGPFLMSKTRFTVRYEDEPDVPLSVSFHHARFMNNAALNFNTFEGRVFFDGSHFSELADFSWTSFQQVSFDFSSFDKDCDFEYTFFEVPLSLREVSFHTVSFSSNGIVMGPKGVALKNQFNGTVNLSGMTYSAFHGSWKSVFRREDGYSRFLYYDRQPYTQLEATYRKVGFDESADAVYLDRRKTERKLKWGLSFGLWLRDAVWALVNYGIGSLWRLMILTAALLALGTAFLIQPGVINTETRVGVWGALVMSLRWFFPFDLPLRSDWQLGTKPLRCFYICCIRPDTFVAFFLRLPGYVIIPFAILSLTGYLKYVGQIG